MRDGRRGRRRRSGMCSVLFQLEMLLDTILSRELTPIDSIHSDTRQCVCTTAFPSLYSSNTSFTLSASSPFTVTYCVGLIFPLTSHSPTFRQNGIVTSGWLCDTPMIFVNSYPACLG